MMMKPTVKMKKFKKILLTLCILSCVLCGCSVSEKSGEKAEENLPVLNIGVDGNYEPYSYIDDSGNYVGLDIELAEEACKRMNRKPVFKAIPWYYKDEYLSDGTIDCVWSCFSMNGREDDYDWVGPYMCSRQVVVVRSDSEIESFEDLNGKSVAVMSSTKPESIFLAPESDEIPNVDNVYSMENMNLVFSALQLGYVDAAAGHETVMKQYIETASGSYRLLDENLLSARVGVAFEKGKNTDISAELSAVLKEMEDDGTLRKMLDEYGISAESSDGGDLQ